MSKNPWQVDSVRDFCCIKCPECEYFTKEETLFENHATQNHPLSFVLFDKKSDINEDIFDSIVIKEEPLLPMTNTFVNDYSAKNLPNEESEKPFGSETFVDFKIKKKEQSDKLHEEDCELGTSNSKLECDFCIETYSKRADLNRHISSVHDGRPYQCEICKLYTKTEESLKQHKFAAHYELFRNDESLFQNNAKVHDKKKSFLCDVCNVAFVSKEIMERHIAAVHEEKNCQISKVEFSKEKSLETHQKRVHGVHEETSGIGHYENVPKKKKLLFVCKICNGEFTSGETLKNHIRDIHEKANSFETQDLIADKNAEFLRSLDML